MSRNTIKSLALSGAMMTVPLVGLTTTPAEAARSVVQIGPIRYNAPGPDSRANASLNGEHFSVKNMGHKPVNLNRWTVRDAHGNMYRFGNYLLPGKSLVEVRSGVGVNTSRVRYWNRSVHVWGNLVDRASLRSPSGHLVDTWSWNFGPLERDEGLVTCHD